MTEVDEIHVSKKETASREVTVRLSAVHIEMERPARRPAQNEDESNGDERRPGGGGGEERWTAHDGHRLLGVSSGEAASGLTGKGV